MKPSLGGLAAPPWKIVRRADGSSLAGLTTTNGNGNITVGSNGSAFTFVGDGGWYGSVVLAEFGLGVACCCAFDLSLQNASGTTGGHFQLGRAVNSTDAVDWTMGYGASDLDFNDWGFSYGTFYRIQVNYFAGVFSLWADGVLRKASYWVPDKMDVFARVAANPRVGKNVEIKNVVCAFADYGPVVAAA